MTASPTTNEMLADGELDPNLVEQTDWNGDNSASTAPDNEEPDDWFESDRHDLEAFWDSPQPPEKKIWLRDHNTPPKKPGSPPMYFRPLYISLMDSSIQPARGEKHKHSALIHCQLTRPAMLRPTPTDADRDPEPRTFPAGTYFGIWGKSGMRDLYGVANVECWMMFAGFKDVGQPSLMVQFKVKSREKRGDKLEVKFDHRDKSLPDSKRREREAGEDSEELSFIPF